MIEGLPVGKPLTRAEKQQIRDSIKEGMKQREVYRAEMWERMHKKVQRTRVEAYLEVRRAR